LATLDTKVTIEAPEREYALLEKLGDDLKDVFIVSQIELKKGNEMNITVEKAEGEKCERCWQYATDIKKEGKFPNVCLRCENTLSSL
jgi:isoleucyl-tRNA synthetase